MRVRGALFALLLACPPVFSSAADVANRHVDLVSHTKSDLFRDMKISPDGRFYAATVFTGERTTLVVLERDGLKPLSRLPIVENSHVGDFHWVGPERLVFDTEVGNPRRAAPSPLGKLFGVNHDGSNLIMVFGMRQRAKHELLTAGPNPIFGRLLDDLVADDDHILVSVEDHYFGRNSWVERVNVHDAKARVLVRAPAPSTQFVTDANGVVRFAVGVPGSKGTRLFYRDADGGKWQTMIDQPAGTELTYPIGFDSHGKSAYLQVERRDGTDEIVRKDLATGVATPVLRNSVVDPGAILWSSANRAVPIGSQFFGPQASTAFFDESSAEAKLLRRLEAAFPGQHIRITSTTRDGALALVEVGSATNPGDFYLFDTVSLQANHVLSRRTWIDTDAMAPTRPVRLTARDGEVLHGFLTVPAGAPAKGLPMILLPHGGPFGVYDRLEFDSEVQLLAAAGYAVLKVNFRGSGNYGRRFRVLGARQWGGAMQDDLTDATRWAVAEGIADPGRICIYGASYGAYAALMGVATQPSLYRCAVGYVGVYDLERMVHQEAESFAEKGWHRSWVGDRGSLAAISPVNLAGNIRVPVFLAAGGRDRIAPLQHTTQMEVALKRARVPVELLVFDDEGHGFYADANREEYYRRLLAFLAPHLGGRTAMPAAGKPTQISD